MIRSWLFDPRQNWSGVLRSFPELAGPSSLLPLDPRWLECVAGGSAANREIVPDGLLLVVVDEKCSQDSPTPGLDAAGILTWVLRHGVPLSVIGLARAASAGEVDELRAMSALDVLTRDRLTKLLPSRIAWATELHALRTGHRAAPPPAPDPMEQAFLYRSPEMKALHVQLTELAATHHDIVIVGETGAGKERVAREIHRVRSPAGRGGDQRPFVEYNCALSVGDRERQKVTLFGVGGKTYTNVDARPGLLEETGYGDLFLDEVEFMEEQVQGLLLRALETRTISRVGYEKEQIQFHCRILLGFKNAPKQLADEGKLREDFMYRLVAELRIPPLRERREDIPLLAYHFLMTSRYGVLDDGTRKVQRIAPETLELLKAQEWRGNVRALRNVIEAALIHLKRRSPSLRPEHIVDVVRRTAGDDDSTGSGTPGPHYVRSIPPDGVNVHEEVARLKVELLNAAYARGRSLSAVIKLLGYTGKMALHRERERLRDKFPDLYDQLVPALKL